MKQCPSIRLWNRCFLIALVLFVIGSALCTVAGSAAAQERRLVAAAVTP